MATINASEKLHAPEALIPRLKDRPNSSPPERLGDGPATAGKPGGEERRRSQRVLLRIRANVHVNLRGKQTTLEVRTLSVNPYGAMIISPENLPPQTRLVLENVVTHEKVACRVVRLAKDAPEGFHVPIEFDAPSRKFWMIDFPPEDWRPLDDL
jgi:hypothetical protein